MTNFENYCALQNAKLLELDDNELKQLMTSYHTNKSFTDSEWEKYNKNARSYIEPELSDYGEDSDFDSIDYDDIELREFKQCFETASGTREILSKYGILSDCSSTVKEFADFIDEIGYPKGDTIYRYKDHHEVPMRSGFGPDIGQFKIRDHTGLLISQSKSCSNMSFMLLKEEDDMLCKLLNIDTRVTYTKYGYKYMRGILDEYVAPIVTNFYEIKLK